MPSAEPHHVKRFTVIVVVRVYLRGATHGARSRTQSPASYRPIRQLLRVDRRLFARRSGRVQCCAGFAHADALRPRVSKSECRINVSCTDCGEVSRRSAIRCKVQPHLRSFRIITSLPTSTGPFGLPRPISPPFRTILFHIWLFPILVLPQISLFQQKKITSLTLSVERVG